eukprot:g3854.t1
MDLYCIASSGRDGLRTWNVGSHSPSLDGAEHAESLLTLAARDNFTRDGEGEVACAKFNHNGQVMVSSGSQGRITLRHANGTKLGVLQGEGGASSDGVGRSSAINCLNFSSGSRYLACGGASQVVRIWDLKKREIIRSFRGHADDISCVEFSKGDKHVASGDAGGKLLVFDVVSGKLIARTQPPTAPGHGDVHLMTTDLSFSQLDKRHLATAYDDGSVHLWDMASIESKNPADRDRCLALSLFTVHRAPIKGVAFSPKDAPILASVGFDKRLVLSDVRAKPAAGIARATEALSCLSYSPSGDVIFAGTVSGSIVAYDLRRLGGAAMSSPTLLMQAAAHSPFGVTSLEVQPISSRELDLKRKAVSAAAMAKEKVAAQNPPSNVSVFSPLASTPARPTVVKPEKDVAQEAKGKEEREPEDGSASRAATDTVQPIATAKAAAQEPKEEQIPLQEAVPPAPQTPGDNLEARVAAILRGEGTERKKSVRKKDPDISVSVEAGPHRSAPVATPASAHVESLLADAVQDIRREVHADIQCMHVELLRQFRLQLDDIREVLDGYTDKFSALVEENKELRRENLLLKNIF